MQLARVDGIAQVVAFAVGDIGYQIQVLPLLAAKQTVYSVDHHLDDVDVLPFIETAYVIGVGNLALVEYQVDGARVILNVEPIAHVLSFAVDGQRLAMSYVVDEQRYQLFGEVIGTIVV